MRRTPIKRKTPLRAKTQLKVRSPLKKRVTGQIGANKRKSKDRLPSAKTVRNKCDSLLTPIIKLLYPRSILSGAETQVAHHHVHKSKSSALRYYIPNLIPLTHSEHLALHNNESFYASKIVQIRGIEWFEDIEKKKNEIVKTDVHWYMDNYERLLALRDSLS